MVDGSDVEILVHTTAPSRGPDDARYRALAHAYLNFQPATRQKIELDTAAVVDEEEPGSQLLGELNQSTLEERESEASYRPEEETAPSRASLLCDSQNPPELSQPLSSPGLSFTSVLDSPVFRPPITWHQPSSQSDVLGSQQQQLEGVWPDAPSTVADSQPENDRTMAARASPETILELMLQQIDTSEDTSIAATASQRSTHPSSQSINNAGGVAVVPVVPVLPMLPLPINESCARTAEVQVARTSSADEVMPAKSSAVAHYPHSTIKTAYNTAKTTTSSESAIPATPTPAMPQSERVRRPGQSSSPILGSVVPATSTPPVASSSGRQIMVDDDSNSKMNADLKPAIPSTSTRKVPRTPLPNGKVASLNMGLQKETTTVSALSGSARSKDPEKVYELAPKLQNDRLPATQVPNIRLKSKRTPEGQQVASSAPAAPFSVPGNSQSQNKQRFELASSQLTARHRIPISDSTEISMSMPSSQSVSPWADKLEIRPPMPPASTANPKLLWPITHDLAKLAETLPIKSLFCPMFRVRDLRESERGYWRVNSENWDTKVRADAWKRLGDFIGKGRAGWGCSCIRFEESPDIRVYCPGNLVGHIYMVLIMASSNKIKNTGACWIGGDGEPVIKMA